MEYEIYDQLQKPVQLLIYSFGQVFNSVIGTNYSKPEITHSKPPFGEGNRTRC